VIGSQQYHSIALLDLPRFPICDSQLAYAGVMASFGGALLIEAAGEGGIRSVVEPKMPEDTGPLPWQVSCSEYKYPSNGQQSKFLFQYQQQALLIHSGLCLSHLPQTTFNSSVLHSRSSRNFVFTRSNHSSQDLSSRASRFCDSEPLLFQV
jgi:hypothetical protein